MRRSWYPLWTLALYSCTIVKFNSESNLILLIIVTFNFESNLMLITWSCIKYFSLKITFPVILTNFFVVRISTHCQYVWHFCQGEQEWQQNYIISTVYKNLTLFCMCSSKSRSGKREWSDFLKHKICII